MKNNELFALIDSTALDCMSTPGLFGKKTDGSPMNVSELAQHNAMIAFRNDGIRVFIKCLKDEITSRGGFDE